MKRFVQALLIVGAILVTPLAYLAPVNAANVPYGVAVLKEGSRGAQVAALQSDLRDLGYFTYADNTGYYGSLTKSAVLTFQRNHHLMQNGMVGMTTAPLIQQEVAKKHQPTASTLSTTNSVERVTTVPHKKFGVFQNDHELSEFDNQADAVAEGQKWDHCSVRLMSDGSWVWSDYPSLENNVINSAKRYIGTPYVWGGTQPGGFDCSGFVSYVLGQYNISMPRTAAEMWNVGSPVNAPAPGDLVFFTTYHAGASHVGIYLGNGQFISATSSYGVAVKSLVGGYWGARYLGARHVL